jgi:hypothetical protein
MKDIKIHLKREVSFCLGNAATVHMPLIHCCQLSGQVKKMLICFVRNIFYDLEKKPGHLASQTEFFGTLGQRSVKYIKPGLSWDNWDEWDPYVCGSRKNDRQKYNIMIIHS